MYVRQNTVAHVAIVLQMHESYTAAMQVENKCYNKPTSQGVRTTCDSLLQVDSQNLLSTGSLQVVTCRKLDFNILVACNRMHLDEIDKFVANC